MMPDLLTPQALHQMARDLGLIGSIDSELSVLDSYLEPGPTDGLVKDFGELIRDAVNRLHYNRFDCERPGDFASSLFSSGRMALVALFALRNALVHERELLAARLDGYVMVPEPVATHTTMAEVWQIFERGSQMEAVEDGE